MTVPVVHHKLDLAQRRRATALEEWITEDPTAAAFEIIALRDAAEAMCDFAFSDVEQKRGYRAAIRAFCRYKRALRVALMGDTEQPRGGAKVPRDGKRSRLASRHSQTAVGVRSPADPDKT